MSDFESEEAEPQLCTPMVTRSRTASGTTSEEDRGLTNEELLQMDTTQTPVPTVTSTPTAMVFRTPPPLLRSVNRADLDNSATMAVRATAPAGTAKAEQKQKHAQPPPARQNDGLDTDSEDESSADYSEGDDTAVHAAYVPPGTMEDVVMPAVQLQCTGTVTRARHRATEQQTPEAATAAPRGHGLVQPVVKEPARVLAAAERQAAAPRVQAAAERQAAVPRAPEAAERQAAAPRAQAAVAKQAIPPAINFEAIKNVLTNPQLPSRQVLQDALKQLQAYNNTVDGHDMQPMPCIATELPCLIQEKDTVRAALPRKMNNFDGAVPMSPFESKSMIDALQLGQSRLERQLERIETACKESLDARQVTQAAPVPHSSSTNPTDKPLRPLDSATRKNEQSHLSYQIYDYYDDRVVHRRQPSQVHDQVEPQQNRDTAPTNDKISGRYRGELQANHLSGDQGTAGVRKSAARPIAAEVLPDSATVTQRQEHRDRSNEPLGLTRADVQQTIADAVQAAVSRSLSNQATAPANQQAMPGSAAYERMSARERDAQVTTEKDASDSPPPLVESSDSDPGITEYFELRRHGLSQDQLSACLKLLNAQRSEIEASYQRSDRRQAIAQDLSFQEIVDTRQSGKSTRTTSQTSQPGEHGDGSRARSGTSRATNVSDQYRASLPSRPLYDNDNHTTRRPLVEWADDTQSGRQSRSTSRYAVPTQSARDRSDSRAFGTGQEEWERVNAERMLHSRTTSPYAPPRRDDSCHYHRRMCSAGPHDRSLSRRRNVSDLKMPEFGGDHWLSFFNQFESACNANQYSETERGHRLRNALTKRAVNLLANCGSDKWTYQQLVDALEARYGRTSAPNDIENQLNDMRKKPGQSALEFADALDTLASKAKMTPEEAAAATYHSFKNGLRDFPSMHKYVLSKDKEKTLRSAANLAAEWERSIGSDAATVETWALLEAHRTSQKTYAALAALQQPVNTEQALCAVTGVSPTSTVVTASTDASLAQVLERMSTKLDAVFDDTERRRVFNEKRREQGRDKPRKPRRDDRSRRDDGPPHDDRPRRDDGPPREDRRQRDDRSPRDYRPPRDDRPPPPHQDNRRPNNNQGDWNQQQEPRPQRPRQGSWQNSQDPRSQNQDFNRPRPDDRQQPRQGDRREGVPAA